MLNCYDLFFFVIISHLLGLIIGKLWGDRNYYKKEDVEHSDGFNLIGKKTRDSKWKTIRNKFVSENSSCAVCGKTNNLRVHHIIPFHVDPSKELDLDNLVVLCENENLNCHFVIGHLMNWSNYNPDVIKDIETWRKKLDS